MEEKKNEGIKIPLSIPAVFKGKEGEETIVKELTLTRIKLKKLKNMPPGITEANDYASIIPLIAASANVPIEIVEEIDFVDLRTITEAMDPFLPESPQTGEN